jgi:PIN domain nuclease of toxin-antitoxin system
VNLLLDTHAFLWFVSGNDKLSAPARESIESGDNLKLVSIASIWEIGIKASLGRLTLEEPFDELIPRQLEINGFDLLPIEIRHVAKVVSLPFEHRDPFDRILIAQCLADSLRIVSRDSAFDSYGVNRVWLE